MCFYCVYSKGEGLNVESNYYFRFRSDILKCRLDCVDVFACAARPKRGATRSDVSLTSSPLSVLCGLCEEIFFPWQLYDTELFILCGASKHYVAVGFAVSSWRAAQCTFSPRACVLLKSTFCLERTSFAPLQSGPRKRFL